MKKQLQDLLDELHAELSAGTDKLDDESRQQLKALAQDIETAVGDDDGIVDEAMEQIEVAAVNFESEHPRLSGILSNIADTLGKLGI